ncbi:ketopantoate reductase family protein [Lachancea thermotolerans CBS 6340]|uniref:2-dehydropantoate 2-reductase n=1 Tax=Lachancea thermotolerans (strain ATCC 56472 / CBS 6340 / NRRL Y-8284) TaxID=559295 RepID=C5DET0_LACTC|nr:KLTH0C11902p [Lachancea thermotolerans CBS 6340]CAR22291.1 KLTH0C11902p [Lachancea thermotolerans CBS 6340]
MNNCLCDNDMDSKCKVLLVGSGGVGTIASYALEYAGKTKVTSVLRSDYDRVLEKGFSINSCDYGNGLIFKPSNIVNSVEASKKHGPFEYVVIATKCLPEVTSMIDVIAPAITKDTAIVLVQNGIGIEMEALTKFPENVVLSGVSMIGSANMGGHIEHESPDMLRIGYFENNNISQSHQEAVCKRFVDLYQNDKNQCVYDEDVKFSRWRKLVYNACLNPVCALTGVDIGRLEIWGGVDSIIRKAMREVLAIAKSDGVVLPEDVIEFMIRSDDPVYYRPSMLVDADKRNLLEIEVILGNPVRIARKNKVDVPFLTIIYELLKIVQSRTMEEKGMITIPKERPVPK